MTAADIIRKWEGLRLKAYPDPGTGGNPWTIGYGHTRNVKKGDTCTEEQALAWLAEDMADAYRIVDNAVTVPLTTKQRDALCSFVFNVGGGAFQKSTLLRLLNEGNYTGSAAQFPRWNKAGGKVMPGLVKRRGEERSLFLTGTNISVEAFPIEEKPVAPFLALAIPAFIKALPEFAKIFDKPDVAERNVEAAMKAVDLVVQSTGAINVQDAVEKVQADPEMMATANEALRMNRADLMDAVERVNAMDQGNIKAARDYNTAEPLMINAYGVKLKFIHVLSLLFVGFSGTFVTVHWASLTPELKGAVITLMIIAGWNGVRDYWMGSSEGSARKTDMLRN